MTVTHPTHPRFIDNGYLELVSVIGNGAYGVVFYALDYRYGSRPIKRAVKQLRRHGIDERQRRFQMREISLHRRASRHPSIVHMDRLIEEHDCVYVVMDYGDEGDLFAMITEKQRILDGVDWLHQLGIAHRDVKPENIVCSADGTRVRIVDFGLATSESTSTEFGCGSTFYIAPECLGEWHASATSYPTRSADVWSLGVILVNLVCGRNPWRCASPTDESFAAFLQDPTFLRRILPISNACLSILTQIFTLEPEHRITLDRLRELVHQIDSFTEDAPAPIHRSRPAPVPVHPVVVPVAPVYHHKQVEPSSPSSYVDSVPSSPSSDSAPSPNGAFSFDDSDSEIPSLRPDSGSLSPSFPRSCSSSSDSDRFPATPHLGTSSTDCVNFGIDNPFAVAVASASSSSSFTPVFEALNPPRAKTPPSAHAAAAVAAQLAQHIHAHPHHTHLSHHAQHQHPHQHHVGHRPVHVHAHAHAHAHASHARPHPFAATPAMLF